jgi:hypothetical protein
MAFLSAAFSTLDEAWGESALSLTNPPPARLWRPPTNAAPNSSSKTRGSGSSSGNKQRSSTSCDLYDQQMRQVRRPSDASPPVRASAAPPTMTKRTPASYNGPASTIGVPATDSGFWNAGGGIAACAGPALIGTDASSAAAAALAADKALDKALLRETKAAKAAAIMQGSPSSETTTSGSAATTPTPRKALPVLGGDDDPMGPYLDLVLFVASGVLLIFVLEQVLQLGIHIGRRQASSSSSIGRF